MKKWKKIGLPLLGVILVVTGLSLLGTTQMAAIPKQSVGRTGKTVGVSVRRQSPILMPMKTIGAVEKAKYEITVSNNGKVPFKFVLASRLSGKLRKCRGGKIVKPLQAGSGTWTVKTGGAYEEGWKKDKYTASQQSPGSTITKEFLLKPGNSTKFHVTVIPDDNAQPGVVNTLRHTVMVSGVENPVDCKDIKIGKPVPGLKVALLSVVAAGAAMIVYPFVAGL